MELEPRLLLCCASVEPPARGVGGGAPMDIGDVDASGDADTFLIKMPAGVSPGSAVRAQSPDGGPIARGGARRKGGTCAYLHLSSVLAIICFARR